MTTQERIEQTKETLKELKSRIKSKEIELKKLEKELLKENIFERKSKELYFFSNSEGGVGINADRYDGFDSARYKAGNYCRDRETIEKRAQQETLSRLIWRWQKIHDDKIRVDDDDDRYEIIKSRKTGIYSVKRVDSTFFNIEATYFNSKEKALKCIEEVVKPYMRGKVFSENA